MFPRRLCAFLTEEKEAAPLSASAPPSSRRLKDGSPASQAATRIGGNPRKSLSTGRPPWVGVNPLVRTAP